MDDGDVGFNAYLSGVKITSKINGKSIFPPGCGSVC